LKLDLGCGRSKREGFSGVDAIAFPGVDIVTNLADRKHTDPCVARRAVEGGCTCPRDYNVFQPWPWEDNSIDEAFSSHFVEHLDVHARKHFVEQLWRVLKPEATAQIVVPYAFSERAYGDLTHAWPPLVGFWFFYLDAVWCAQNSAHHTYLANFSVGWGHNPREDLKSRNPEYVQEALAKELNASMDMIANFTKKPMPVT
jgi:hypothetical protein